MNKKIHQIEVKKINENGEIIDIFYGLNNAAIDANVHVDTIRRYNKKKKPINGFLYEIGGLVKTRDVIRNKKNYYELVDGTNDKNPDVWDIRTCPICGKQFYVRKKYKRIVCSDDCHNKYMELNREVDREKRSNFMKNRMKNLTQEELDSINRKRKQTHLEKYGCECYQKTDEYRLKQSELFKSMDWSKRSETINNKLIPKYQKICENDNLTLLEFRNRMDCTVKCNKCGSVFDLHVLGYLTEETNSNLCRKCHPNKNTLSKTKPLEFIENIIKEANIEYEINVRNIIPPYEIDIYIPLLKVGFEVNGNYWHSEIGAGKVKNYHINKTLLANDKDIRLIQIFEDEILLNPEIVRSRVLNIIGKTENIVYARKTTIMEIKYEEKKQFFNKNHISGDSVSSYNIGLFHNNELVSVMSFCKRKISKKSEFEMVRFANKVNYNVIGGFSKLLKYFIKTHGHCDLITYADIRWSGCDYTKTVYAKNGFEFMSRTQPNYFYVNKCNYLLRLNRLNFTKSKLIKKGFDTNLTETQIMFSNGYDRIWDCGSLKFKLK